MASLANYVNLSRQLKGEAMISHISPVGSMALLSQLEVNQVKLSASCEIYQLFRNCSLAVLNSGSHTDSSKEILEKYKDFEINVLPDPGGPERRTLCAPAAEISIALFTCSWPIISAKSVA